MKCFNCKARISNVDKYCPRCGTLFDNGDVKLTIGKLIKQYGTANIKLLTNICEKNSNGNFWSGIISVVIFVLLIFII